MESNYNKPESQLLHYSDNLKRHFEDSPPATIKQAAHEIEEITGIKRSPERVRIYLKRLGLKFRKVGMIPAKVEQDRQDELKKTLEPLLEEAKSGRKHVYFVDAAHFVLGPFLGFLWSFSRVFIKVPSGRQRFNVLGASSANDHELVTVENDSYINALSVSE